MASRSCCVIVLVNIVIPSTSLPDGVCVFEKHGDTVDLVMDEPGPIGGLDRRGGIISSATQAANGGLFPGEKFQK